MLLGYVTQKHYYFNAFGLHFARVQNHLKELDY